jgi:alpha-tubulin suppressor-like RCC1 family protein
VVFGDSIGEFQFSTMNCNVTGRFVTTDSATGEISCTVPYPRAGTWAAGRAGPPTTIAITPDSGTFAAWSGTLALEAVVRDDEGRRLHGRAPVWDIPNDFSMYLESESGGTRVIVRSFSTSTATVRATYHGLEATALVRATSQLFTQIAAGASFTCGLTQSGEAWCWGSNFFGQLGAGKGTRESRGPVRVLAGFAFSSIDAGGSHACGRSGTDVYCWGANHMGQLGVGDTLPRAQPARVTATSWTQVSAGDMNTCAVDAEQAAWCWGYNGYPVSLNPFSNVRSAPTRVAIPGAVASAVAGGSHACALTTAGAGFCWGQSWTGVLGVGVGGDSTPRSIAGNHAFASLSGGASTRMCGLTSAAAVYCWGLRPWGISLSKPDTVFFTPEAMIPDRTFSAVSTYGNHICAIDAADSSAWCWGQNEYGELGSGFAGSHTAPARVGGNLTFTSISVGASHACGITTGGVTYCWGSNALGQLGDGTTTDRYLPVRVGGQP